MNEEEQGMFDSIQLQNQQLQNQQGQLSMFANNDKDNLIRFQLNLNEELERLDHLLRGHSLEYDENGNEVWVDPPDDRFKPFNEYGVRLIMNIISFYINKNTILSNYDEDMIYWKMEDLSEELSDLIFHTYEEMGMDTREKVKLYPIIVRAVIDSIHSTYLRALNGGERNSLRKMISVNQSSSDGGGMNNQNIQQPQKKPFSFFGS